MAKHEEYVQKTEKLLGPIIEENHFELYDVEYVKEGGNWYLRVFIDKEGGITIDDCELVSRYLSDLLDKEDYIPDSYILEVSSPGLGRQLKKDKHLQKSIGEEVEIKLYQAIDKKKEFIGTLIDFNQDMIKIETEDNQQIELPRKSIALVRLTINF
ncbi:MAG: ribosome maturation factor RimP [Clostridiales bacterium]|nr:ribosome maturation factor RimP [Clostridiales bacterium]